MTRFVFIAHTVSRYNFPISTLCLLYTYEIIIQTVVLAEQTNRINVSRPTTHTARILDHGGIALH